MINLVIFFALVAAEYLLIAALWPTTWLCHKCAGKCGTAPAILYPWLYGRWRDTNCPHCRNELLRPAHGAGSAEGLLRAAIVADRGYRAVREE